MLPEKVKKLNIAAGVWFVSMFALLAMILPTIDSLESSVWDEPSWLTVLVVIHGISLFAAFWYYSEAKGYPGALGLGLGFLYALGLIILLFLKDKHKEGTTVSENPTPTPSNRWKIYLAVLCVVLIGGVLGFGQTYDDAAYFIGYYLFPSIVVAAISYATFGKGGGKLVGTTIFVAVYASFVIGSLISIEIQRQKAVEGIEYFLDQADALTDAQYETNDDGTLKLIDKTFSPSASATGSMAVMQEFMADLLNRKAALTNEYQLELEASGWTTILDPSRLQADSDFEESRRLLDSGKSVAEKYRELGIELMRESGDRIQELNLPAAERREFQEGYERGVSNAMSKFEEIWDLEIATLNEFENIINMLAEGPQSWSIEEGQILFATQEQLDRYNGYMTIVDLLAEEQFRLQKANIEAQREKLADF